MSLALWALVALFSIWAVYPAVIGALAWRRPIGRRQSTGAPPTVSIVIATRDDSAAVRRRVENCRQARYDGAIDIVISIDASATTDLADLALDDGVQVVHGDQPGGKAAALNAGVRAARGSIVVFTDTHQRFTPDTIAELAGALGDPRFAAVSGRLELPQSEGSPSLVERYWRLERWLREREARLHSCIGVTGAVWAMRRDLWTPIPPGLILDDVFTPMRLVLGGHRVGFADRAHALETRSAQAGQEYRRKVRTLTGVLQLCAWMPGLLSPFRNPVWGQFIAHKLLRLLTPYLLLVIAFGVLNAMAASIGVLATAGLASMPLAIALVPRRTGLPRMLREGLLMQTAAVVAAANGARGRWEVWGAAPAGGQPQTAVAMSASTSDGRSSPEP